MPAVYRGDPQMSHILTEQHGHVLQLRFNRGERKNAITSDMYRALADAFAAAEADAAVRVVLIQGDAACFTAGNDLKDFADNPPRSADSPVFRFLQVISHAAKPIVAAVAGPAVGIGTTLLLHCDLVYAAPNARFQLPFTNLGLCPEAASSYLLPHAAGYRRAAELLMLGEPFGAEQAREAGIVTAVVAEAGLLAHALAAAQKLAAKPPASLRATKQLMRTPYMQGLEQAMAAEIGHFGAMLSSPEAKEAFAAFFEKRPPDFSRFS
jgi:enoyl-CoA hydratase/carnithine racemase